MTDIRRSITHVVDDGLCTGCGICENVCAANAIGLLPDGGQILPHVDQDRCTQCGLCDQVCPGHEVFTEALGRQLFSEAVDDPDLGKIIATYSGHCVDHDTRWRGASGGMVTGLLQWLLRSGQIDGAIVVRFDETRPLEPKAFIARNEDEIAAARSSKYCPVTLSVVLRQIVRASGRYAVVGLPCHLHGIRKMTKLFPVLGHRLKWHFGIFCSGTRNSRATEFFLSELGVVADDVKKFAYRDEGCLGNMMLTLNNGEQLRWPYKEYYPSTRSFFLPARCALCHDQCAELADLSFGDLHIPEFWDDHVGTGSVIARSPAAQELLYRALAAGVIVLSPLDKELVRKSQRPMLRRKKHDVPVRIRLMRAFRCPVPVYDAAFVEPSIRDRLRVIRATVVLKIEQFIGSHRDLWWIIRVFSHAIPPRRSALPQAPIVTGGVGGDK